jgi:hypothetical protein
MNITLKDVARHANVSTKTVSRVVNKQTEFSATTRAHVHSTTQALGYRPNLLAHSLINKHSNTITVVASGIQYSSPLRSLLGIERQPKELGYALALNLLPNAETASLKPIFFPSYNRPSAYYNASARLDHHGGKISNQMEVPGARKDITHTI